MIYMFKECNNVVSVDIQQRKLIGSIFVYM